MPESTESRVLTRYLHTRVHNSIIHNDQKVDAAHGSVVDEC